MWPHLAGAGPAAWECRRIPDRMTPYRIPTLSLSPLPESRPISIADNPPLIILFIKTNYDARYSSVSLPDSRIAPSTWVPGNLLNVMCGFVNLNPGEFSRNFNSLHHRK